MSRPAGSRQEPAREWSPMIGLPGLPDRDDGQHASHGSVLAGLRQALARGFHQHAGTGAIALGIPSLDAALGGGLARSALHEIAAAREAEIPAASGFALILAA